MCTCVHSAYVHFPSVLGCKWSCETIDLGDHLYWKKTKIHSIAEEVKVGGGGGGSQFHHLCDSKVAWEQIVFKTISIWIPSANSDTCLVNKGVAPHRKLLSYPETLWEGRGEISGSREVRHPQQYVVALLVTLGLLSAGTSFEWWNVFWGMFSAEMKEHGCVNAQMCLTETAENVFSCFHTYINRNFPF